MKKSKQIILTAVLLTAISSAEAQTDGRQQNDTARSGYHTNVRHSGFYNFFHREHNRYPNSNNMPRSGGFGNIARPSSGS